MKYVVALFVFLVCAPLCAQQIVSFQTELNRLSDISLLPRYMEGTLVKQISSYDTTGGNDDGFGGRYSYLRKEPSGGLVVFEHFGQGVIERIWTPTPTDDMLDFYFDGNQQPGLSIKFRDLFNNSTYPFLTPLADHKVGGFYSYIPIPYKKSCRIVFRGEKILFHQIQYREYDNRYQVQTFQQSTAKQGNFLIDRAVKLWNNQERSIQHFNKVPGKAIQRQVVFKAGGEQALAQINQGGRITGIELKPTKIFEGLQKELDLKITWDDEQAPAVYVPVADFFGYAFGARSMEGLLIGTTRAKAYVYLPMPFDRKASVSLVYRGKDALKEPFTIDATVYYTTQKRNPAIEGKFYSYWKNESPALGSPYIFLEGAGKGHYVGTLLQSQATEFTNFTEFFEGDDYTAIDGKMTVHGTGSEDYFNGGWYAQPGGWVERLGAALSGCLDYTLPLSRTGGYRFFLTDKMPFNKSILHQIEHGPERNNRAVQYTSVAMYYADKPVAKPNIPDLKTSRVYIPDTVTFYTRLMRHLTYNGNLQFKEDKAQLTGKSDATLNINVTEVPQGKYKIYLHQLKSSIEQLEVRTADATTVRNWQACKVQKGDQHQEIYIGETVVADNAIPVNILFKTNEQNPLFIFDRVSFIKQ